MNLSGLITQTQPNQVLLPWLTYTDYLMHRLKEISGQAQLHVLHQEWTKPNWWDRQVLQIDCNQVMHREILITSQEKYCWYARTIIPDTTYKADLSLFSRLKDEPLGNLIFKGSMIKRHSLLNYVINPHSIEYYWLTENMKATQSELWVRLSEFKLKITLPFYLIEILLPGIEAFPLSSEIEK